MAKNLLVINVDIRETRVALIENGIIAELHIERETSRGTLGNIYLGKVSRVLPGMQAAFIDVGLERAAFLHVEDLIRPDDFEAYLAGHRRGGATTADDDRPSPRDESTEEPPPDPIAAGEPPSSDPLHEEPRAPPPPAPPAPANPPTPDPPHEGPSPEAFPEEAADLADVDAAAPDEDDAPDVDIALPTPLEVADSGESSSEALTAESATV